MINKFKNWIRSVSDLDIVINDDINVDIAKENYQKYQDDLEQKRRDYIKSLCRKINEASRHGCKSIETETLLSRFMTYEFLMEIKKYFEQRGFLVTEESNGSGVITSWLRISWEE